MHSTGKSTQVGMVENVHSIRIKREFCKPATKSDSYTTPEKGLVQFGDRNDTWRWWYFELKTTAMWRWNDEMPRNDPYEW